MSNGKPLSTRAEARSAGRTRFRTGRACKWGHVAERSVCSGKCVECQRLENVARRKNHREEVNAYNRDYRARRKAALNPTVH